MQGSSDEHTASGERFLWHERSNANGFKRAPRHARRLASVSSPPLSTLLTLMNVPSDDLFAEMLTKQLGVRTSGKGTIAAGAHVLC